MTLFVQQKQTNRDHTIGQVLSLTLSKHFLSLRKVIFQTVWQVFRLMHQLQITPSQKIMPNGLFQWLTECKNSIPILLSTSSNTAAGAVPDSNRLPY